MTSCNSSDNVETLQKGSSLSHVYDESTNPVVGLKRPSHQNSLTQRHYQSMRKKRKVECETFSKPTLNEVSIYPENLSKAEEEVCGVCFREDDQEIQQNINWIYISPTLPVLSGVPQGSILGPLLFLIYVNDFHLSASSSTLLLFADDTKCFNMVHSPSDSLVLQQESSYVFLQAVLPLT